MSTLDTAGSTEAARLEQRRWLILGVVGLAQLMIVLDITIMNIALPSAQAALHFNNADRQWVITAYSLVVREPAAVRRPDRRPVRPQGRLHHRAGRVRGGLGRGRRVGQLRHARDRASQPGSVRGAAGAGRAVAADHDVHQPGRAEPGVRHLRSHRRRRRPGRPAARRRAHRVPGLALVPVREPAVRRGGRGRGGGVAEPPAARRHGPPGRAGHPARLGVDVLPGLRVLQRRDPQVGRGVDLGLPDRGGGAADRVRDLADPRVAPAAAAAGRAGPQPGRCLPGRVHGQRGPVRHLPVPDLLPADDPGLHAGDHRPRVPAHGRRADDLRAAVQRGTAAAHRARSR